LPCVLVDPGVNGALTDANFDGYFFLCFALGEVEVAGEEFFVVHIDMVKR